MVLGRLLDKRRLAIGLRDFPFRLLLSRFRLFDGLFFNRFLSYP